MRDMTSTQEDRALARAKYLTGLMWHIGVFVVINAFLWTLDLVAGQSGIQWAFWITLFWGFGLAFHVVAYLIDGRQFEERAAERYLKEQQEHSAK
jgi:hypothetical protein